MKTSLIFLFDGAILVIAVGIPIVLSMLYAPIEWRVRYLGWSVYRVFCFVGRFVRGVAWSVFPFSALVYFVLRSRHQTANIGTVALSLDLATGYIAVFAIASVLGGCTLGGLIFASGLHEGHANLKRLDKWYAGLNAVQRKAVEVCILTAYGLAMCWPFVFVLFWSPAAGFLFGIAEPLRLHYPDDPTLNQARVSVLYLRIVNVLTIVTHNPSFSKAASFVLFSIVLPVLTGIVTNWLYDRFFRHRK